MHKITKLINYFFSNIVILLIKLYKLLRLFFPKTCRFYPSCSTYSIDAIKKKGLFLGLFLTLKRLLKCNSFYNGGIDFLD